MKVSVAIATYNGSRFIIKQLESIRKQTRPVDEVILTDDCSSDDTVEVVNSYIKEHGLDSWSISVNEKNLGNSSNFFYACSKTTGDIIFFADQDDEWVPEKVEEMTNLMGQFRMTALSSMNSIIDAESNPVTEDAAGIQIKGEVADGGIRKYAYEEWIGTSHIPTCSMCISGKVREMIKKYGYPQLNISMGEDWWFGLIAATLGDTYRVRLELYRRRIHDSNLSLSRLRKTTLLTSTKQFRIDTIKQAKQAHEFYIGCDDLYAMIDDKKKKKINRLLKLYDKRIKFVQTKNPFTGLSLMGYFSSYNLYCKRCKGGSKRWLTDVLYAYNVGTASK